MNVLVIEDDPDTVANLREVLAFDGHGLVAARTAGDAMAHANWSRVGAVIIDKPVSTSEAEPLLSDSGGAVPQAPVVVITGHTDLVAALTALEHRASMSSLRPINPTAIRQNLSRLAGLRSTEGQFAKTSLLAAIGEITAEVAHELNNAFGTVTLRLETLLNQTPTDDPNRASLEIVEQEVERMAGLVSNLREISEPGRGRTSSVDVGEEVDRALSLVAYRLARDGIDVTRTVAEEAPHIQADRHQMRQILLNLFTNAADAMPNGGQLTVHVFPSTLSGGQRGITIEVADTGVGIPPEILPHVIEAFFTTKEEGKGTGLGLSISKRLVEEHGGELSIRSDPGVGTTVRASLPVGPLSFLAQIEPERGREKRMESIPAMTSGPTI